MLVPSSTRFNRSQLLALGESKVIQAEMVRNARSDKGWDWSNEQEVLDLGAIRQMVSRIQDAHRNTVRYLELAKKSGKYNVQIDPSLLRLMTSEFGGASDFIKSLGPDNSVIMLYSCPSCNTAPLRIKDWLYGRPSEHSSKKQYSLSVRGRPVIKEGPV